MVYAPGVGEVAISISSDPDDEDLEHTIRIVGRTTRVIEAMEPGDVLGLRGPYGTAGRSPKRAASDVLVVTGGLGCAPVSGRDRLRVPAPRELRARHDPARREEVRRPRAPRALRGVAARDRTRRVLLTADQPDRAWRDRSGVVTELFDEVEFDPARTVVLMCGPEVMMRYAIRILRARGVSRRAHLPLARAQHEVRGRLVRPLPARTRVRLQGRADLPAAPASARFLEVHGL